MEDLVKVELMAYELRQFEIKAHLKSQLKEAC